MLSGVLCYRLEATSRLQYYTCVCTHVVGTPLATQKTTASTYATSTIALLDNYKQQFE